MWTTIILVYIAMILGIADLIWVVGYIQGMRQGEFYARDN
jgi:hypothetical protein